MCVRVHACATEEKIEQMGPTLQPVCLARESSSCCSHNWAGSVEGTEQQKTERIKSSQKRDPEGPQPTTHLLGKGRRGAVPGGSQARPAGQPDRAKPVGPAGLVGRDRGGDLPVRPRGGPGTEPGGARGDWGATSPQPHLAPQSSWGSAPRTKVAPGHRENQRKLSEFWHSSDY